MTSIELYPLSEDRMPDFELLTAEQEHGGCYCAFWHLRITSMDQWIDRQRDTPELNLACIRGRITAGFHTGVLAYREGELLAWISVSPVPEVYWTWRRVAALGEEARTVAGITCINMVPAARGAGLQRPLLEALSEYGRAQGWSAIEAYPFDDEAVARHGAGLHWPGLAKRFREAGYVRVEPHWLSSEDHPRSVYRVDLTQADAAL